MSDLPVLQPSSAAFWRHRLLALAALAGAVSAGVVLSSQEVTDFLREGPVRVTALEGDRLQLLLGLGTLLGTGLAVGAIWSGVQPFRLAVAGLALAGGVFLVHALFMPAAALVAVALATEGASRISRDRLRQFGPRRYPVAWAIGGAGTVAGAVALIWLSVWLVQPLFDEGTNLNEGLAFAVEGVDQPAIASAPAAPAASQAASDVSSEPAAQEATPSSETPSPATSSSETGSEVSPPAAEATGTLISRGELMGADAFHTASGQVLLLMDPDGGIVLRFQNFDVRNGPDLHIYLTPDAGGDVHANGAIDLGAIKATSGFVNYEVPAGLDPASFQSVVIYCQPFSVIFATAQLGS